MTRFRVEYAAKAQQQIEQIYFWIKKKSPVAADKWLDDLLAQGASLAEHPLRYPLASESKKFPSEIRLMLFRKRRSQFRIYYTVDKKRVVILTVRRSTRKPLDTEDLNS